MTPAFLASDRSSNDYTGPPGQVGGRPSVPKDEPHPIVYKFNPTKPDIRTQNQAGKIYVLLTAKLVHI